MAGDPYFFIVSISDPRKISVRKQFDSIFPNFRSTLPYDMFLDKISDGIILCNFGNTVNAMTGFGARRQISNIMYPDSESDGS